MSLREGCSPTKQSRYCMMSTTYKEIASRVGNANAARAVGRVEATNPIPIIIPCHRVLGTDGSLHGYGGPGGIKLKAWLLDLERRSA